MPHINRIRVNNVKYNFGTQFYDDFILRFSGKNTIYDLANGGGKSILMLLLLQNMIPNCTLDEKQPMEKLFRTGNGNSTIHSLVEWQLNSDHIKNGYQYMTTGFCARKGREHAQEQGQERENAVMEYFNYVIFYREFNDNDIKNLPLSNGRERITYTGLKNYLKDLEHKAHSLIVKIFDRKGEYQQFISQYGIYESEWEIIRGINKTEGHVRTYFETNYKTTRKVVEDLLIEEILQKSYYNHTGEGEDFAKLLLDIKNKLVELAKKKKDIHNYDHQMEVLESFLGRIQSLKGMYHKKGGIEKKFACAYHTCEKDLKALSEELETLTDSRSSLLDSKRKKKAMVDTALVQVEAEELSKLDKAVDSAKLTIAGFENQLENHRKQLLDSENANDYLEYLEYKKEYEAAQFAVSGNRNQDELQDYLRQLSACFYTKYQEKRQEYTGELSQLIVVQSQLLDQSQEEQTGLQNMQDEIALKKSRLLLLEEEKQREFEVLETKKNHTSLLLFEEAALKAESTQKEQATAENLLFSSKEEERQEEERLVAVRLRMGVLKGQKDNLLSRQGQLAEWQKEYGEQRDSIEKLKEFYGQKEENCLKEAVFCELQNNVLEQQCIGEKVKELKRQQESYRNGELLLLPEQIEEALEIINVGRERAVTGQCYLKGKSLEQQTELLEICPILPYSIIVFEDYESIQYDKNLKKLGQQGRLLPIIHVNVLENSQCYDNMILDFLAPDKEWFLTREIYEKLQKDVEKMIQEQEKKRRVLQGRLVLLKEDLSYLENYEIRFQGDNARCLEEYEKNKLSLKDLENEEENLQETMQSLHETKSALQEKQMDLQKRIQELSREKNLYLEIAQRYETYCEKEQALHEMEHELTEDSRKKEQQKEKHIETLTKLAKVEGRMDNINNTLKTLEGFWELEMQSFYQEETQCVAEEISILTIEELQVKFKGSKAAYLARNADLADKEKLAHNYKQQMERCLSSISYRGGDLERLKADYENMSLSSSSLEERKSCKEEIGRLEERIRQEKKNLDQQSEQANRKFGSVEHGKTLVQEKYGVYQPMKLSGQELQQFIKEYKKLLAETEEQLKELQEKEKQMEKEQSALETMREDMLHMMESAGIDYQSHHDTLRLDKPLKQTYKELKELYEKVMKEEYQRRETFEKDKNRLKETLILTNAHELAGEVEKHIVSPESESQAEELMENIKDTISCIQLEKSGVEKGIEDMEKIKYNFESQCIQTCINMKSALDRLSKLSGIVLDDKTIPMITLSIPYIKEELYESAMSNYINQVIETADSFGTENERVKYIRSQLAWKKLFSVIVKDMNLIKLNLYKRERIKEQSRYLKYEEAVGSTGQSQGIYIQFLVAIIHYITSMNSANSDPHKLKNVIFIDNPFGAAKDVYIWEPIFKLLKANNVQLIVPARGATPAITGRFEVNYILGQKLMDGRQQTVVVDYRSQTRQEELEYTSLTYEQNTLEF
ncbi:MAG: hypothetical protein K2M46_13835 [Lachnospiraceae bacterium]|nr:hypothetical protein [Lachnospiraceae bacterium]